MPTRMPSTSMIEIPLRFQALTELSRVSSFVPTTKGRRKQLLVHFATQLLEPCFVFN
jgi:hypothetical protein